MLIGRLVNTPIGQGIYQGDFVPHAQNAPPEKRIGLVRIPIDDETRKYLSQSNCLTPKAQLSGLWIFNESELQ